MKSLKRFVEYNNIPLLVAYTIKGDGNAIDLFEKVYDR